MDTTPAAGNEGNVPRPARSYGEWLASMQAERLRAWSVHYELAGFDAEWSFKELVINSLRVDDCRIRMAALRVCDALRDAAARSWAAGFDARRPEEVGAAFSRLPGVTSHRPEAAAAGCRRLLRRRGGLASFEDREDGFEALEFVVFGVAEELRGAAARARHESERSWLSWMASGPLAKARPRAGRGAPSRESSDMRELRRQEAAALRRCMIVHRRLTSRSDPRR